MHRRGGILLGLTLLFMLLYMSCAASAQTTCNPAWNSTTAYTGGMKVSLNGINYTANFWTQGQNPATNNGGAGSGQPWTSNGSCSGSGGGGGGSCATPWVSTSVYTAGMTASGRRDSLPTSGPRPEPQRPTVSGGAACPGPRLERAVSALLPVPTVPSGLRAHPELQ